MKKPKTNKNVKKFPIGPQNREDSDSKLDPVSHNGFPKNLTFPTIRKDLIQMH